MHSLKKAVIGALAAAVVISSIGIGSAEARSRHHHRGNAAVVGAVIGLFGVIAATAAADSYRDRYYGRSYYYGPGPYAYDPGYGYAPRYRYRHHRYHRHHGYWR